MTEKCMYCGSEKKSEDAGRSYPPYAYDKWVCDDCWNSCPDCGCSEWNHKKSRSTRKNDKKVCEDCSFSFITKPATG